MIYTDMTKKAMKLAYAAHKGQLDKGGTPYIFHPIHIAEQMDDEETTIVALLHDVVEDTEITLDRIRQEGFAQNVVEAIALMTHDSSISYLDYVRSLKNNSIAAAVKLADLKHNSDRSRLATVDGEAAKRLDKYKQAIEILEGQR